MSRAFALFGALVVFLAVGASSALAGTISYSGDGSTVIVTGGDNLAHNIQFRLSADMAHDEIIDTQQFSVVPGDCTAQPATTNTWFICPAHTNVQVDLGSGSDVVSFDGQLFDCFNAYTINLGEGSNELHLSPNCPTDPAEAVTMTSGAGSDTFTGGDQNTTNISAGAGDDSLSGGTGDDILHGGDGNDRLFGHEGNDQVFGEGGNDDVDGGAGNDLIDGGIGDDRLEFSTGLAGNDAGLGDDTYVGGAGNDSVWFDKHAPGMTITLDGLANDGIPGSEHDNVGSDIEDIEGTDGNDTMTGSPGPDGLTGGLGNDTIHGGDGADHIYGSSGDDKVFGDGGNDKVEGATGADTVDGGAGADELYGDIAGCSVFCSFDSDTLLARDGEVDRVDCGGGSDTATVDQADVVSFCTVIDRAAAPGPAPGPTPAPGPSPGPVAPASVALTVSSGPSPAKGVGLTVACPAACTFTVTLTISASQARKYHLGHKALVIGAARGTLLAAGTKKVTLKLSSKALSKLRKAKSVSGTLKLVVTNAAHKKTTKTKAVTLKRH